ncbi:hypothetical protein CKO44_00345 [Rubrivivax gelatinosus]|uniref:Uncharacterized protein n=1 Tax=Rubrivivax gelatinosus TaxID=28068 RepID=A0ABS1DQV5_RUBGE|nr:hypothetical protein [Rubrivivax gelatinosus]MBK1611919.1 hypothetical protein [Rubrivivax gelatinosus]MBK1711575.1 hypothetical protein [Rubrivivax gelatinosus]
MLILFTREAEPDAPYWTGRVLLGALDALAWPAAWMALAFQLPERGGMVGGLMISLAALAAVRRLHTALCENHRYRFTTWKVGKVLLGLYFIGVVMKLLTMLPQ